MKLSKKDMQLIKGALRRAFCRSELYAEVVASHRIEHSDPNHPKCKNWSWCGICGQVLPSWRTTVDHIQPVVPVHKLLEEMTIPELQQRIWCHRDNLQVVDKDCHKRKSLAENAERRSIKKATKKLT